MSIIYIYIHSNTVLRMQITQQENICHKDLKRSKGEKDFDENTVTYINNTNGKILSGLVKVSQRKLGRKL